MNTGNNEERRTDMPQAASKVAVVRCGDYEQHNVERAVLRAVELLGGFEAVFSQGVKPLDKNSHIVLKPNLLAKTGPEKACTTHPAVFKAVGRLLQNEGYGNLSYGDSPGNPMILLI